MRRRGGIVLVAVAATLATIATVAPPARATVTFASAPVAAADHPGSLRAQLEGAMRATVAAGATGMITLVDDGDDTTAVAVGAARLAPRRPISTTDQVRVGSITKSFVATVALQLVGERRLRLDDTIEHWLPGVVPNGSAITIRMLLNHTSGVYNYTDDPAFIPTVLADPSRIWSPRELIAIGLAHPPGFAPGAGWSYSNTGYLLIGLVLEAITSTPIQTLLERRVIRPLHLPDTYFAVTGRFRGAYAHGYLPPSVTGAGYLDTSAWTPSWAWAAGAVVSTARDLARFYQALLSGRLLGPALLRELTTTVDAGPGVHYGLGIFALDTPCGTVWGHDGGVPGYLSFAFSDRSGRRSAVVLLPTQADDAIAAAGQSVLGIAYCGLFGQPAPSPAAAPPAITAMAARF